MNVQVFVVGMLSTDCYVVHCRKTKAAIVIDPGFDSPSEAEQLLNYVDKEGLKVKFIVDTHGHDDHIGGNMLLKEKYKTPICIHKFDAEVVNNMGADSTPANVILNEGDALEFGDAKLRVMHTAGHSPGSICLLGEKLVFTGDTLFAGGIGRTDFAGGSDRDMRVSLGRLARLPDGLVVYPGHGPATTIGEEKRFNPFLRSL
jgi:glyoxylase-like metal-dependent hydrolase (beta-lactamase superfamily II)